MWRQATAAAFLRAHTSNIEAASLPSGHAPAPISRSGRSDAPYRLRSALRKKWCLGDSTALFCNSNNRVFVHKRLEIQPLSADTAIEFLGKTFAPNSPWQATIELSHPGGEI